MKLLVPNETPIQIASFFISKKSYLVGLLMGIEENILI